MLGTPQRRQRLVQWQEQLKQSKLEHYLQYHLQQHLQQQYLQQHLQQQLQQQLQQRLQQQLGDTQLRVQQCACPLAEQAPPKRPPYWHQQQHQQQLQHQRLQHQQHQQQLQQQQQHFLVCNVHGFLQICKGPAGGKRSCAAPIAVSIFSAAALHAASNAQSATMAASNAQSTAMAASNAQSTTMAASPDPARLLWKAQPHVGGSTEVHQHGELSLDWGTACKAACKPPLQALLRDSPRGSPLPSALSGKQQTSHEQRRLQPPLVLPSPPQGGKPFEQQPLTLHAKIERLVKNRILQQMVRPSSSPDCNSITSRFRLRNHITMTEDFQRVGSYQRAIRIRCGNAGRAQGTQGPLVIEIGTGPFALLSVNAAREGARRVVAFEAERRSSNSAAAFVKALGYAQQIKVIRAYSTDLTPEHFSRILKQQDEEPRQRGDDGSNNSSNSSSSNSSSGSRGKKGTGSSGSETAAAGTGAAAASCEEDGSDVLLLHEIIGDFAGNEGAADVVLHLQQMLTLLQLEQGVCTPRLPKSVPVAARSFLRPCCFPDASELPFPHHTFCQRSRVSPGRKLLQAVGLLQQPLLLACSALAVFVLQGLTADPAARQLQAQFQQQQHRRQISTGEGGVEEAAVAAAVAEAAVAAAVPSGNDGGSFGEASEGGSAGGGGQIPGTAGGGVRPVFEELLFEEAMEEQQQQRRLLDFAVEKDGLLAGLCITNEVELAPGVCVGTESCRSSYTEDTRAAQSVSGTSCWFKGLVLLQQEIPVLKGDIIRVISFADLQNFVRVAASRKAARYVQGRSQSRSLSASLGATSSGHDTHGRVFKGELASDTTASPAANSTSSSSSSEQPSAESLNECSTANSASVSEIVNEPIKETLKEEGRRQSTRESACQSFNACEAPQGALSTLKACPRISVGGTYSGATAAVAGFEKGKRVLAPVGDGAKSKQRRIEASKKKEALKASPVLPRDSREARRSDEGRCELPEQLGKAATGEGEQPHEQERVSRIRALKEKLQQQSRYSRPRYLFSVRVYRGSVILGEEAIDVPIEEQCPDAPPDAAGGG
ncbi:uncharacterized protein LOC34621767 [Cyclospora cayetanensis]|uniref:type I protein arginine methyltransferase n=1 Tax=Cyclospora cayetanensis TaxID=88456 RepID=A0A6P6S1D5_9EIME|nr:uncharacterized protein LOC34621767 [Cyclospora cayetanensis]